MPADLTLGNYEIDESNGDLVIRDAADNIVLRYDDAQAQWEFPAGAAVDVSELIDGAGVSDMSRTLLTRGTTTTGRTTPPQATRPTKKKGVTRNSTTGATTM